MTSGPFELFNRVLGITVSFSGSFYDQRSVAFVLTLMAIYRAKELLITKTKLISWSLSAIYELFVVFVTSAWGF